MKSVYIVSFEEPSNKKLVVLDFVFSISEHLGNDRDIAGGVRKGRSCRRDAVEKPVVMTTLEIPP